MKRTFTESITKSILDEASGEVIQERYIRDTIFDKTFKQGWRMYYIDYDDMLEKVVRSNKDIVVINYLKTLINRDFELIINITKESKKLSMGRDKLSKILSRLVDANFLKRTDVGFKSNPYMYIPYRANDIKDNQDKWKEYYV